MSFTALLNQTCTLRRRGVGTDGWQQPAGTFTDLATLVPCRLMAHEGREVRVGVEALVSHHTLFLDPTDVTEQDQVVVGALTFNILLVKDAGGHGHHLELALEQVRG